MLVKEDRLSFMRRICFGYLIYSMWWLQLKIMYTWNLLSVFLPHTKKQLCEVMAVFISLIVIMISQCVHKSCCTLYTYIIFISQSCFSKAGKKKKGNCKGPEISKVVFTMSCQIIKITVVCNTRLQSERVNDWKKKKTKTRTHEGRHVWGQPVLLSILVAVV